MDDDDDAAAAAMEDRMPDVRSMRLLEKQKVVCWQESASVVSFSLLG
jgi:hypothetical protein